MAKKKFEDPIVASMSDALGHMFNAVIFHAIGTAGPEVALQVIDGMRKLLDEQTEDIRAVMEAATTEGAVTG